MSLYPEIQALSGFMKRPYWVLFIIVISSLLLRLGLLTFIQNPGLNDQNHYYNLGTRLLAGDGFTIDYVWHYSRVPESITHPIDHWMPAAGIVAVTGMAIFGESAQSALAFFILAGSLLPVVVFLAAKQYELSDELALIAATFAISLPDIVWNSLRTDTTILNMVLVPASIIAFLHGVRHSRWWAYLLSGALGGLAYLTRNDSILILPLVVSCTVVYLLWGSKFTKRQTLWQVLLVPIAFFVVASPWLVRNAQTIGSFGSPETDVMFFMVDAKDHYAYNMELTFESMFERQSTNDLINKRLFELVAAFKQLYISLDVILPLLVPLGLLVMFWERDRDKILVATPVILWVIGILIAYPILLPLKSQSGSFEKAYLTIVPLLLPFAAIAIQHLFVKNIWRVVAVILALAIMGANSFDVARLETQNANRFFAVMERLTTEIKVLPDLNNDDDIRVMSQDPFPMSYFGVSSIMTPLTNTREDVLELARFYDIDYLVMPAARPALDDLYLQQEIDPRFEFVTDIRHENRILYEIYAIQDTGLDDAQD